MSRDPIDIHFKLILFSNIYCPSVAVQQTNFTLYFHQNCSWANSISGAYCEVFKLSWFSTEFRSLTVGTIHFMASTHSIILYTGRFRRQCAIKDGRITASDCPIGLWRSDRIGEFLVIQTSPSCLTKLISCRWGAFSAFLLFAIPRKTNICMSKAAPISHAKTHLVIKKSWYAVINTSNNRFVNNLRACDLRDANEIWAYSFYLADSIAARVTYEI